jgi:hypothetical protein
MAFACDEYPVGAFPADGAYPPLGDRVRPRRLRRRADDLDVGGGEHRIERGGELAIPISQQEPRPIGSIAEVDQQVAGGILPRDRMSV